ncbi:hypothetical protein D9M68_715420 [compost metagenome]
MLGLDVHRARQVLGRGQDAVARRHAHHARRQQRGVEAPDVARHVGHRRGRAQVAHIRQRIAELQVQVDQQHRALARQLVRDVGRKKGRAAAALAGHERHHPPGAARLRAGHLERDAIDRGLERGGVGGRRQHLAHARAHRVDQELGRLHRAQQHHRHRRMPQGQGLHQRELLRVAAHAVDQQQVGCDLVDDRLHPALAAFEERHGMAARLQHLAHVLQVVRIGGNDGDLHGRVRCAVRNRWPRCAGLAA